MSSDDNPRQVNRRSVLRSTSVGVVGATAGGAALSSLLGTVSAEEPTQSDRERLEDVEEIQEILVELGVERLPGPGRIEKRQIKDDGEITDGELLLWKVEIRQYGTLLVTENGDDIGSVFMFDPELSKAPSGYAAAEEANASLGPTGSDLTFSRNATDQEEKAIVSAIGDEDIDGIQATASTSIDGFYVSAGPEDPDDDDVTTSEYVVEVDDSFDVATETLSEIDRLGEGDLAELLSVREADFHIAAIPDPRDIVVDIIRDWIVTSLASESLDYLGVECNTTCPDCVMYIIDVATTCRSCLPACSSGASGVGAIVCVACFYAFCNDSLAQADCLACLACVIEGEEPDTPETNPPRWVLDQLPSPPSNPL
ncbi:hypothetical protein G6M89_13550 [Natronolimnobius sp. AArcel1]|uniref:DUF753 domain-containing protein n=1 Tax=Natronolimnobius sp. AArcel1 TaxID=1679093 RepID=UPI0013EC5C44|nr:DUF753 domain-containing protein [Natronolimnobius sp. AArcel1]NGM70017.1 hypothetical protein [Natronolimnobius sp. AArcel1]